MLTEEGQGQLKEKEEKGRGEKADRGETDREEGRFVSKVDG